jgi:hypothetical protein
MTLRLRLLQKDFFFYLPTVFIEVFSAGILKISVPKNGNIRYIGNLSMIEIKFRKKFRQKMTHFVQEST